MTTPTDAAIARVYEQYPLMAAAVGRERIEAIVQVAVEECALVADEHARQNNPSDSEHALGAADCALSIAEEIRAQGPIHDGEANTQTRE